MDIACPQCGNPKLQVDEANSVVYCQKCGFAVKVDPQTGKVTPLSKGGGGGAPTPPSAYASGGEMSGPRSIIGMDPITFFMVGIALSLLLTFMGVLDTMLFMIALIIIFYVYWTRK